MADGYTVKADELRKHAANLDSLKARFAAVKSASAHITQDDQAYGLLCGWMAGVLEGRHTKQDTLVGRAEENLSLVAQELRDSADDYDEMDAVASDKMKAIGNELGGAPR
jgi:hypothetical protein